MDHCPCQSGLSYAACCRPFHAGALPQNALQLMRSRYTAYAYQLPDYIMQTTHPKNQGFKTYQKEWRADILSFCQNTTFQELQILEFIDGPKTAFVTFFARLLQNRQDASFTEKSQFEKVKDRWLYYNGIFLRDFLET